MYLLKGKETPKREEKCINLILHKKEVWLVSLLTLFAQKYSLYFSNLRKLDKHKILLENC